MRDLPRASRKKLNVAPSLGSCLFLSDHLQSSITHKVGVVCAYQAACALWLVEAYQYQSSFLFMGPQRVVLSPMGLVYISLPI